LAGAGADAAASGEPAAVASKGAAAVDLAAFFLVVAFFAMGPYLSEGPRDAEGIDLLDAGGSTSVRWSFQGSKIAPERPRERQSPAGKPLLGKGSRREESRRKVFVWANCANGGSGGGQEIGQERPPE
jgi:hypothetical protein